jgi:hypothetical protein
MAALLALLESNPNPSSSAIWTRRLNALLGNMMSTALISS